MAELSTHDVDDMLDEGVPVNVIAAGNKLNWHGRAILDLIEVKSELRAILPVYCEKCGKELGDVLLGSGIHNGAWSYAYDAENNFIANLRDERIVCKNACKP